MSVLSFSFFCNWFQLLEAANWNKKRAKSSNKPNHHPVAGSYQQALLSESDFNLSDFKCRYFTKAF